MGIFKFLFKRELSNKVLASPLLNSIQLTDLSFKEYFKILLDEKEEK